jgi:predicted transcriptional regulator
MPEDNDPLLGLTAQIISAHVTRNHTESSKLPDLIREVYLALARAGEESAAAAKPRPAVPANRSVFPEYLVCL